MYLTFDILSQSSHLQKHNNGHHLNESNLFGSLHIHYYNINSLLHLQITKKRVSHQDRNNMHAHLVFDNPLKIHHFHPHNNEHPENEPNLFVPMQSLPQFVLEPRKELKIK